MIPADLVVGRVGAWMSTSLGNRFFPDDPRSHEVHISDIANGLSLTCRYAGQGRVDKFYSVAEHSTHLARYAYRATKDPKIALYALLHDAAEAYISDLCRAAKMAVGEVYNMVEEEIETIVFNRYGLIDTWIDHHDLIKEWDCRIVPLEKEAIFRYPQPWAFDRFEPLEGVVIQCWNPVEAKVQFMRVFEALRDKLDLPHEEWEV